MNSALLPCTAVLHSWYLLAAHPSCDFRPVADVTNTHQLPHVPSCSVSQGFHQSRAHPPALIFVQIFLLDFTFTACICTAFAKPQLQSRPCLQGPLQTQQGCAAPDTVPADGIGQKMEKKEQKGQRNAQIMQSAASSSQITAKQKWQVSYVRCLLVQEVCQGICLSGKHIQVEEQHGRSRKVVI